MTDSASVYLVDDDDDVRKGLSRFLRSAGYHVESFGSAREFLDGGHHQRGPACLVLDVQMPDLTGLDLQRELAALSAALPIVFITGQGDIPTTVEAMKAGAVDFLAKPVRDTALLAAVRQGLARAVRDQEERAEADAIRRRAESLTPREREVMALVVAGRLNKQIADALGTVEHTIKLHRGQVMKKMQVASLADLVRAAEKLGTPPKPRQ